MVKKASYPVKRRVLKAPVAAKKTASAAVKKRIVGAQSFTKKKTPKKTIPSPIKKKRTTERV